MKETYCIVYQAGLANVFLELPQRDPRSESGWSTERIRVMQDSFRACEVYCRGLRQLKGVVRAAWCNEAGDIKNSIWHFYHFDNAPFNDKFATDFVPKDTQEDDLEKQDLERAAVANDWEEHTL